MSVKTWLTTRETITEPRWWWLAIMATMVFEIVVDNVVLLAK